MDLFRDLLFLALGAALGWVSVTLRVMRAVNAHLARLRRLVDQEPIGEPVFDEIMRLNDELGAAVISERLWTWL